ncbi:MAG: HD family phosphohydrolase [Bacillota bacterium]
MTAWASIRQRLPNSWLTSPLVGRLVILAFVVAATMAILAPSVLPERVSLEVGQPSPQDIEAPRTTIDRIATDELRRSAAATIPIIWEVRPGIKDTANREISEFIAKAKAVQLGPGDLAAKIQQLKVSPENAIKVPDELLRLALESRPENLDLVMNTVLQTVNSIYDRGIKEEDMNQAKTQAQNDIGARLAGREHYPLASDLALRVLRPNVFPNQSATEKERQRVMDAVESVKVLKGQSIIRKGQIATEREITILQDLGMQRRQADMSIVGGLAILILSLYLLLAFYLVLYHRQIFDNLSHLFMLGVIFILTLLIGKAITISLSGYLVPVAAGVLLVAILLDAKLAILVDVILSILVGFMTGFELSVVAVALVGGVVAIYGVNNVHQRTDLIFAGLLVGVSNTITIGALNTVLNGFQWAGLLASLWGLVNGVLTGVLAIGFLPFLEGSFAITSPFKLMEISNPNHPLLKRLLVDAPGTYHHSIVVANLAEAAADAIGADSLLARVGVYFHVVGKVKRPVYFIENQVLAENPHDQLPPSLSAMIITQHVKEGLDLAREHKLPNQIQEIIQQHHGTTLVSYFYHRAKEMENASPKEEEYRYPGPKPTSKEAAIVMLADCVEAAVRSLSQPTSDRIESLVKKLVQERLAEGQLDEADLTLKELGQISQTLSNMLISTYHQRVQYPKVTDETSQATSAKDVAVSKEQTK